MNAEDEQELKEWREFGNIFCSYLRCGRCFGYRQRRRNLFIKPTVPQVLPLIKNYYSKPENAAGGNLHIILEDGNILDGHIKFCLEYAKQNNDQDGVVIAELLLKMSKTQRNKICSQYHLYC